MTSEAKRNLAEKRKIVQTSLAIESLNECPTLDLNLRSVKQPFSTPSPVFQTQSSSDDQHSSMVYYDNYYPQYAFNPSLSSSTSHYHNSDNPSLSSSTSHYHNGDNPSLSSSTSHYHNGGNHQFHSSSTSVNNINNGEDPVHHPYLSDRRSHPSLASPFIKRNPNNGRFVFYYSCLIIVFL
jgi:hypothetical protein